MTRLISHFIQGEFRSTEGARLFDKRSPVDGRLIARVAEANQAEVDEAVRAAQARSAELSTLLAKSS